MKKLLYIIRSMAMVAGTERVATDKMNWLAEHGYEITLVTYEQGNHPIVFPLHPGIKVYDLDTEFYKLGSLFLLRRYYEYLKMKSVFGKRLKSIVETVNPDIVSTTAYSLKVADEIVKACKHSRLILESHETCFSVFKEYDYQANPLMRIVAKVYDLQYYHSINQFDRIVTLTDGDANGWRKHVSTEVVVIPNPLTYYPLTLEKKSADGSCRLISAGRIDSVKGFDMLIDAFSLISDKCPEWHIDIFGQGSIEKQLRTQIADKGLEDRVIIHSPTAKIYDEYCKSDIYVLSSRHEGLGMSLIEAMSCGIPCVAFDCKYGPAEILTNRETGLLVEDGNVAELAKAMLWLIEHPEERLRMGLAARESAKRYSKDNIMHHWVELFDRLS